MLVIGRVLWNTHTTLSIRFFRVLYFFKILIVDLSEDKSCSGFEIIVTRLLLGGL
jgi:hypothetical protein